MVLLGSTLLVLPFAAKAGISDQGWKEYSADHRIQIVVPDRRCFLSTVWQCPRPYLSSKVFVYLLRASAVEYLRQVGWRHSLYIRRQRNITAPHSLGC
ncbi:hypothetical protein J3E68DRAFT_420226 [Trichoderma sp. SZMC 28012]